VIAVDLSIRGLFENPRHLQLHGDGLSALWCITYWSLVPGAESHGRDNVLKNQQRIQAAESAYPQSYPSSDAKICAPMRTIVSAIGQTGIAARAGFCSRDVMHVLLGVIRTRYAQCELFAF
jgi:hypothetical protein